LARRIAQTHQRSSGTRSAAEELARNAGGSAGAAREAMDTSARLPGQPELDTALRRGELSPAQAGLISAAAAANPSQEHRLTELAPRVSLAELRAECARITAAADPDPEATSRRLHAGRRLRRWTDSDGFWNLHANGTAQAGAVFNTVLDPIIDRIFTAARGQGRREHRDAYAFDALIHLADHATGHSDRDHPNQPAADADAEVDAGVDPAAADADRAGGADPVPAPGVPAGREPGIFAATAATTGTVGESGCVVRPGQSTNPRYLALLRVDAAALRRGQVQGEELCEITGVGPVPVSVARDLLGDAILKLVITTGVDVANLTHLGRGPTAAQRAALLWTNPTCSVQGCHRRRIEYDHQKPWAQTKHTRLDELDPLCGFHHDLKTRLHWALIPGTSKRPFLPPDHPRHPRYREPPRDRSRSGGEAGEPTGTRRYSRGGAVSASDRSVAAAGPNGRSGRLQPRAGNDGNGMRRPRDTRRARSAGQPQPDLFAEPQPP
jgi:hypothetical protein